MPFTAESFLDELLCLPGLMRALPSPDGKLVAWGWARVGPAADIFVAPADGHGPPGRLTSSPQDTYLVSWCPDSKSLLVCQDNDGDERMRLYRVRLSAPGKMEPLTEEHPDWFLRGGQLHPNGRWLVYGANRDPDTGKRIEQTLVYRQDLQTGEMKVLARPNKGSWVSVSLSPTGGHVLYTRKDRHPAGRQLWLVDIEGAGDAEIVNVGDNRKVEGFWTPDGERVLVLADGDGYRKVGLYTVATGELKWLVDDPTRSVEDLLAPNHTDKAVVMEIEGARRRSSLLDLKTGALTALPSVPGNLSLIAPTLGGQWLGVWASAQNPADVMVFDLNDLRPEAMRSVTRLWERTRLKPADLCPAEDYRWTSVDGLPIQGWLYRAGANARGTILHVHGGPTSHSEDRLNPQIQFFVRSGFNVLDPNYRGSTGFGLAFMSKVKEDGWGGREQDDLLFGIKALMDDGVATPYAVGMTGTSYGGYSSWCGITRFNPEELIASAPICGMTDLVVDYHTTRPDLRPYSEEMMGGTPEEVPKRYYAGSPCHFVANIRGRLLIIQGSKDPNVTMDNVREVMTALDSSDVSYETLIFADEGHGVRKPRNQRYLYVRLAQFFAQAVDSAKRSPASN